MLADTTTHVPQQRAAFTASTNEDINELWALHGYQEIFHFSRVHAPVARPGHWAMLEVDNTRRTITYRDTFYEGGDPYVDIMEQYLRAYEETCTGNMQHRGTADSLHITHR